MPEAQILSLTPKPVGGSAARFDAVSLTRGGKRVIDELSFGLPARGVTALMGENGAGKSLTLRLLAGLIAPEAGAVRFPGARPIARDMALVFQKPVLLRRSVRANLDHALRIYGAPRSERRELIASLLKLGRLEALAEVPARALSGGEQQRVAMVRALAARPQFLLLDEPTASLDPQATMMIEALVRRAVEDGAKVVLVTHDRGQAMRLAADIVFLRCGKLAESAPAARFFIAPASAAARAYLDGRLPP